MPSIRLVLMIVLSALGAATAHAGALDHLSGRWVGWGKLVAISGASEKLKCVTTYRIARGGAKGVQNFRCNSPGYRLDAVVNYATKAGKVTGDWRERIYVAGGDLKGKLSGGNLSLILRSETFVTRVRIKSGQCRQTIQITPSGGVEIKSISVDLSRC